jgi:hypothetical protein
VKVGRHIILTLIFTCIMMLQGWSQTLSNLRQRIITPVADTITLDSLIIIPGTFALLRMNGEPIPDSCYTLDGIRATLLLAPGCALNGDTLLLARFRVFPPLLRPTYRDERLKPEQELKKQPELSYLYGYDDLRQKQDDAFLNFGELEKSGSISRSVSVGNNQDAVLNSTMNLQLSGELAPGITIVAAITDNTIPIQPEGSSQQLREFDKVFIKAASSNWEVVAGDFDLQDARGEFLRFSKKGQGLLFSSAWKAGKEKQWSVSSRVSGSVAKGKYATNQFGGVEGNQGPYRLYGANNEQFIVVLAGSERVYLDGKLLVRGADNDYVIDYNSAQITFTPKQPVTRDKRFMVMFEYAERNFNRTLLYVHQEAATDKMRLQFQYYNEQDMRGQPMGQEQLLEENMPLLKDIGDDLSSAVVYNIREVPYNNSEVLYRMTDTLVGTTLYPSVFVYSTHPDSARYRLGFSFVGQGKGNYRQVTSAANGKVFQWVAPQGGILQGDYEPVIQLITPKRQQMVTFSGSYMAQPNLRLFFETALSGVDLNTYSDLDDDDNTGFALTTGFQRKKGVTSTDTASWLWEAEGLYRYTGARFSVVERFKDIEFERDWNIPGNTGNLQQDEHYGKFTAALARKRGFMGRYTFEPLVKGADDYSLRHSLAVDATPGKWHLGGRTSLMESENSYLPGSFLRHMVSIDRRSKGFKVGLLQEGEENRQRLAGADTLLASSFAFQRWQFSLERADTFALKSHLRLGQRYDYRPLNNQFAEGSRADEVWMGVGSEAVPDHRFDVSLGYRKLNVAGASAGAGPEESLLGRGEYHHRLLKGLIRGTIFYEFGSGLEYRKEFTYLEVAPGQGVYTWNDYNGDSVKQLDEFEIALFQDEASWIRIFTPTNEFERVYTMQYSQSVQIDPASVVNRNKPLGKFLARFNDQGQYRVEQKIGGDDMLAALDPFFIGMEDPALISLSYSLRNTLFYNRSNPKYSIDYTTSQNASRILLVNGFDARGQLQHQVRARWNITRAFILRGEGTLGERERTSEYFPANDYLLTVSGGGGELQYQPGTRYRIGLKYLFSQKKNSAGTVGELARLHRSIAEFRYSMPLKGSLQVQAEYIGIGFNGNQQSSLAFEMLEGLRTGNNFTWTLGYQHILGNNMQVNLQYNGRKSPETPMVHVGTVQVRAFF